MSRSGRPVLQQTLRAFGKRFLAKKKPAFSCVAVRLRVPLVLVDSANALRNAGKRCVGRRVSPIDRTRHPGRALLEHLIHDVLSKLLNLSAVRVSGPHNCIVIVANEFNGSLDFITQMEPESKNRACTKRPPLGDHDPGHCV
jgi:hypothetical protein